MSTRIERPLLAALALGLSACGAEADETSEEPMSAHEEGVVGCSASKTCQNPRLWIGDFTGDGRADFADHEPAWKHFWVHENIGGGKFAGGNWTEGSFGLGPGWDVLVGDFTGDGLVNLVDHHIGSGQFWVHENKWGYVTPSGTNWAVGKAMPGADWKVLVGDFNGDGLADFADYYNAWGRFWIHLNNGNGTFQGFGINYNGHDGTATGVAGPDWKILIGKFVGGDNLADYADVQISTGRFWLHKNLGNGKFSGFGEHYGEGLLKVGAQWDAYAGDFDGDGWDDVLDFNANTGEKRVQYNQRANWFSTQQVQGGKVGCMAYMTGSVNEGGVNFDCRHFSIVVRADCNLTAACNEAIAGYHMRWPTCAKYGVSTKTRSEGCPVTE